MIVELNTSGLLDQAISIFNAMQGVIVVAGLALGFALVNRVSAMIREELRLDIHRDTEQLRSFSLDTSELIESPAPEPIRQKLPKKCISCGASTIETFHGKDGREACLYCGTTLTD